MVLEVDIDKSNSMEPSNFKFSLTWNTEKKYFRMLLEKLS
jgi:hypothetical protein